MIGFVFHICSENTFCISLFSFFYYYFTGFYCEDWGLFEPSGPCQAGYYCIAGTLHTLFTPVLSNTTALSQIVHLNVFNLQIFMLILFY